MKIMLNVFSTISLIVLAVIAYLLLNILAQCCQSGSSKPTTFIWQTGNIVTTRVTALGGYSPGTPGIFSVQSIGSHATENYIALMPIHRSARLLDVSLIRLQDDNSVSYTGPITFDLVVMDHNGNEVRTISSAQIDYQALPFRAWTPISLSTVSGDLDISVGQIVAGKLTFGSSPPQGGWWTYQLSGTGKLL